MVYGRKLTQSEYQSAICALYLDNPGSDPTVLRRKELELTIDHKLGLEFPAERRDRLWDIQQRIEKRRIRLLASSLLVRLWSGLLPRRFTKLLDFVYAEHRKELSDQEFMMYFSEFES